MISGTAIHRPTAGLLLVSLFTVGFSSAIAAIDPAYVPAADTVIIATLRSASLPAAERELRQLRQTLAANPTNTALALDVARRCVERGRQEADPRFLGHAQIALAPWWLDSAPPVDLLVLRATVRQSLHDFDAALADLNTAVARDPRHAQAWLTKATVHTVRAEFSEARRAAVHLVGLADELTATTAAAQIASLTGRAAPACALLEAVLERSATASRESRLWAETLLAETAARLGRVEAAENHFKTALALAPRDPYLLGAYADFLLDQRRKVEVVELLRDFARMDGLLLRLAEATDSPAQREELATRFAAARVRVDSVHRREEARFELRLRRDPAVALALARDNWQVQREPADARVLLEAARAAADPAGEQEVLKWVGETGLEDRSLGPGSMARNDP